MGEKMPEVRWEEDPWFGREKKLLKNNLDEFIPGKLVLEKERFIKNFIKLEVNKKWNIAREREVNEGDILRIRREIFNDINRGDFFQGHVNKGREVEIPSPTVEGLAGILERFPQVGETGNVRYLLTSGLAVEAITGFRRMHHDTDLVICDTSSGWFVKLLTDNVTHEKYWADMSFKEGYLEETAWEARFTTGGGQEYTILTVHPAILIVQKLSNAWGRPPREKDLMDVEALIDYWKKNGSDGSWLQVMEDAIRALPNERERERTRQRVKKLLRQVI